MNHSNISIGHIASISIDPEDAASVIKSCKSDYSLHDDIFVDEWLRVVREQASLDTMIVSLNAIDGWKCDPVNGNICHETGRFFCITGVHVRHRVGMEELEWDQPMILQPETGILGILAKEINGVLHFCLQAKEEPGNIGNVQLSPTVQATYSNYTGVHGGARPVFLDQFIDLEKAHLLFAKLQTEDGGRFLYKSNRNMVVIAGDDFSLELPDGFIWLTLRQIIALMKRDNLLNACTRSILSSFLFVFQQPSLGLTLTGNETIISKNLNPDVMSGIRATLQWLDDRKAANHILNRRIGLNDLREWNIDGKGFFSNKEGRFFRIVGLRIRSDSREVKSWGQPIIENPAAGVIGLLLRNGENGLELLMQAKAEVGNKTVVQLGPTVQFTQSNYEGSRKLKKPFLFHDFIEENHFPVIHDSCQTEEGARFYREYHRHRILMLPDDVELSVPPDFRWMPLEHVVFLLHLGEQVNSCARSILSCLL